MVLHRVYRTAVPGLLLRCMVTISRIRGPPLHARYILPLYPYLYQPMPKFQRNIATRLCHIHMQAWKVIYHTTSALHVIIPGKFEAGRKEPSWPWRKGWRICFSLGLHWFQWAPSNTKDTSNDIQFDLKITLTSRYLR